MERSISYADHQSRARENVCTVANGITLARVLVCTTLFYIAFAHSQPAWAISGLLLHWLLDALDGHFARALRQETLFGAQIDILADRLLMVLFYLYFLFSNPALIVPVMLYLIEFVFLDAYLSIQFLNWNIISPNYFYKVDDLIWRLNWSPVAKLVNSGLVTLLLVTLNVPVLVSGLVCLLIGIKTYSFIRLQVLVHPELHGGSHV